MRPVRTLQALAVAGSMIASVAAGMLPAHASVLSCPGCAPSIVAIEAGGPVVNGFHFTPGGIVVVTEKLKGQKTPLATKNVVADANGAISAAFDCGVTNASFAAKDFTTKLKSNKTVPAAYPCLP